MALQGCIPEIWDDSFPWRGTILFLHLLQTRRIEQMPTASAIGTAKARHGLLIQTQQFNSQFTLRHSPLWDQHRSNHLCVNRQIIDVPPQRLVLATVAFDPGGEIPLGTSRIEVHPSLEPEDAQPAHANTLPLAKMKDRDVRTALHHVGVEGTTPRADGQPGVLPAGPLGYAAFGRENNLQTQTLARSALRRYTRSWF